MEPIAYKPSEAAKMIGVSLPTMYNFIHRSVNPCPSFRVGIDGGQLRVPRLGLELWVLREAGVNIDEAANYINVKEGIEHEEPNQ